MKMLKTFSLGKICILIGMKPEKNEDPRDTSNHQGKGINQTSLMLDLHFPHRYLICMHYSIWIHSDAERLRMCYVQNRRGKKGKNKIPRGAVCRD